jgi:Ca2+-binding RTX toxin-like protein
MYKRESLQKRSEGRMSLGSRTMLFLATVLAALTVGSGVALAATISCEADTDCFGTRNADTLRGTDDYDHIYGRKGNDGIMGRGQADELYGQGGSDRLFGGGGDEDLLVGGPGNDALNGGAGGNAYYFGPGWGKDSVVDDTVPDGDKEFDYLALESFPDQEVRVTEDLIVKLTSGDGPEVKNLSATNTVNWDGNVIESVNSGDGNDEIAGNTLANMIYAGAGNDTINGAGGWDHIVGGAGEDTIAGGAGNDTIYTSFGNNSYGSDTVDCGEDFLADHDVVYYDLFDQVADNCEEKHLTTQLPNP